MANGISYQPEVLRAQHLSVVHDFTLVWGDLQCGQHIVYPRQVSGRAGRHVMELPLEDVKPWPACNMGALNKAKVCHRQMRNKNKMSCQMKPKETPNVWPYIFKTLPAHFLPPCRLEGTRPCCNLAPASMTCQWAAHCCHRGRWSHELRVDPYAVAVGHAWSGRCWKPHHPYTHQSPRWWPKRRQWSQPEAV